MTRKERANEHRMKVRDEILDVFRKALNETNDFSKACILGDARINAMIRQRPQEKELILSASNRAVEAINKAVEYAAIKTKEVEK